MEGPATLLFERAFDCRFTGCALAHLTLAVEQVEAGTDDYGGAGQGPAIGQMIEYQVAQDDHPDQLRINEWRQSRGRRQLVARDEEKMTGAAKHASQCQHQRDDPTPWRLPDER